MTDMASIRARLEAEYDALSPRLRNAAHFILKEPSFIALYPVREVASRAKVSPATLVRLAKHLGYESYQQLRDIFRQDMHSGAARYSTDAEHLLSYKGKQGFERAYRAAGEIQIRNITQMLTEIPAQKVKVAGQLLAASRRIYVLGLRSNYAPAFYFAYVLKTFLSKVTLLEDRMGMLIDELGGVGPRDTLIAMSGDPYVIETVKAVEYVADQGADVIAITDHTLSPIAMRAKHVFIVPNESASFYHSMVPKLVLLESLVCYLVTQGGKTSVERVKAEFERRENFGVYWKEGN